MTSVLELFVVAHDELCWGDVRGPFRCWSFGLDVLDVVVLRVVTCWCQVLAAQDGFGVVTRRDFGNGVLVERVVVPRVVTERN